MKKYYRDLESSTVTKERLLDEKIQVLKELRIIKDFDTAEKIREIFNKFDSEIKIENLLHTLTTTKYSVEEFIKIYN